MFANTTYTLQYVVRRFHKSIFICLLTSPRISQDRERVNLENLKQTASTTKVQMEPTASIHTFLNPHHHLFWSQQLPHTLNLTQTNRLIAKTYSHQEGTSLTNLRLVISIRLLCCSFSYLYIYIYIRTEVILMLIMEERVQKYGGRLMVI
jgi:hypothetical protein